jgi:hypothetical protein
MGFNTVAVLYNDETHRIRGDGPIGSKIATAMMRWDDRHRDPLATHFGAGVVVSQAHADYSQVVVVGKNTGAPLSDCSDLDWYALDQLADALRRHGWTVKPPPPRKRKAGAL